MGIRVALRHVSKYSYDRPITLNPHVIRLRPAPHARTPVLAYSLRVEPEKHFLNWQQDPYSNHLARVVFQKPAKSMTVTVDLVAELVPINPFDFFVEESAQTIPFQYDAVLSRELGPYLETLPAGPSLQKLVDAERRGGERTVDYLVTLNRSIYERVKYVIRHEPGVQTPEETLTLGSGSCRDSSWLLVQLARHLGLAARFCSGYLIQLVSDEKPLEGPEGPTADFTDLHAWAEVFVPGAGWIGLDPTSGLLASEGHIPLACSADPQTAAPITGSFAWPKSPQGEDEKGEAKFSHEMAVSRLKEVPRVTLPYTEQQWQAINALGRSVDRDLREWDVRLTMGGEPTFVGIDERDAEEWNTAALGAGKRERAVDLLNRLRDRFAPRALLHFGQGKWYPGESLPRWAFGCYWRRDREPIWQDPLLIAEENGNYGLTDKDAQRFVTTLAAGLEVDPKFAIAGYEDAVYHIWRERRLPSNVDPLNSKLGNPEERARLARVFEQGLHAVVGYALPLRRSYAGPARWESGSWFLRGEHMFLLPGDSPMGYRLPLDSLPWEVEGERQFQEPLDPFAPRGPLPKQFPISQSRERERPVEQAHRSLTLPARQESAAIVRTALCVEARGGTMHVFMPPVRFLEDYLDLAAAIEATAAKLEMPVRIEGYKPPSDPRINSLNVTPDPGVIEVNVHPAHSWEEAVENTEAVYEDARQSRLAAEKFMLDGRHTGTGGGNHVVLGGPTAADSPFLRRPDLLRSLVGYWVNHPSLSYLFSGMFVGPTSQHPRVDEARHDALRELEIAFSQLPPAGAPTPPAWLVDRLFRHLLVDATGNTHRTEFCIDKLYSPDTAEGRRGLVELRAFEMPPHARMSCAQQLLLRALVSWFWRKPYERPLVRWETALHDRFMLPHFIAEDLDDVLGELRDQGGYAFDPAWFAPHVEFQIGRAHV